MRVSSHATISIMILTCSLIHSAKIGPDPLHPCTGDVQWQTEAGSAPPSASFRSSAKRGIVSKSKRALVMTALACAVQKSTGHPEEHGSWGVLSEEAEFDRRPEGLPRASRPGEMKVASPSGARTLLS